MAEYPYKRVFRELRESMDSPLDWASDFVLRTAERKALERLWALTKAHEQTGSFTEALERASLMFSEIQGRLGERGIETGLLGRYLNGEMV